MRVLALVPGEISDQILFLPTLEGLKQAFPKAEIAVVVEPRAKAAYSVSKIVNEVIPFDYEASNSPADWGNLLGIVRDREFEVALSTSGRWEEGMLLWLSGVPTRVTYSTTRTPWLYTRTVPFQTGQSQAQTYCDLLKALSIATPCSAPALSLPQRDLDWANATRDRLGIKEGYVVIYPGPTPSAAGQSDSYPIDSWLSVIKDFQSKQPQLPLVLLQTADSRAAIKQLMAQATDLKVVEADSLSKAAAMIAGADLVLTPNSDIMQLAIALQVFTLGLMGAGTSDAVLPAQTNQKDKRFLAVKSSTNQLADLSPDTVLQQVWGS
ncbi:MAG: glycosyltransferase family 9 protein [Leptolyngbya sp. SIO4C1]|nr:glycosyltransferase family 9 protein [Leptolyngbya sp. SIO4C1]